MSRPVSPFRAERRTAGCGRCEKLRHYTPRESPTARPGRRRRGEEASALENEDVRVDERCARVDEIGEIDRACRRRTVERGPVLVVERVVEEHVTDRVDAPLEFPSDARLLRGLDGDVGADLGDRG